MWPGGCRRSPGSYAGHYIVMYESFVAFTNDVNAEFLRRNKKIGGTAVSILMVLTTISSYFSS